jgi:hypothetical protein
MQMVPNGLFPVINHMLLDSHFYIQVRNAFHVPLLSIRIFLYISHKCFLKQGEKLVWRHQGGHWVTSICG